MSFFRTLQYLGQEKQITVSKKGINYIESWTKLPLKLTAMVYFSHVGFSKLETTIFIPIN